MIKLQKTKIDKNDLFGFQHTFKTEFCRMGNAPMCLCVCLPSSIYVLKYNKVYRKPIKKGTKKQKIIDVARQIYNENHK